MGKNSKAKRPIITVVTPAPHAVKPEESFLKKNAVSLCSLAAALLFGTLTLSHYYTGKPKPQVRVIQVGGVYLDNTTTPIANGQVNFVHVVVKNFGADTAGHFQGDSYLFLWPADQHSTLARALEQADNQKEWPKEDPLVAGQNRSLDFAPNLNLSPDPAKNPYLKRPRDQMYIRTRMRYADADGRMHHTFSCYNVGYANAGMLMAFKDDAGNSED